MLVQIHKVKTIREMTHDPDAIHPTEWERRQWETESRLSEAGAGVWKELGMIANGQNGGGTHRHPVVCLDDGRRWESIKAAARGIGASHGALANAVANHQFCRGLRFAYDTPRDRRDAERAFAGKVRYERVAVSVDGKVYPTMALAAKALHVTQSAVKQALDQGRDRIKGSVVRKVSAA